jgi:CheY-like chemotaxis protein
LGSGPGTALVLMSGQSRAALFERTEREQALLNGYMVKPLTAEMFRNAMAHAYDAPYIESTQTNLGSDSVAEGIASVKPLGGMRILVVEDNLINQQVASELLRAEGAEVTLADNGQLGVEALLAADPPFDVVLMDLQMPVMDGLTAARTIRGYAQYQSLPVIAMTANAMASDRAACLEAGMNDHVGKPFDLNDLVDTLVEHTHWTPRAVQGSSLAGALPSERRSSTLQEQLWPPGVDVKGALMRMGGNTGLLQRSIQAFLRDAEVLPARVRTLLDEYNLADVRREMHSLKGVAAALGVVDIASLAGIAEKLAVDPVERNALESTCDRVFAALTPMVPVLQDVRQRLGPLAGQDVSSGSGGGAAMAAPEKVHLVASLQAMMAALQASDMGAMEMHATLRQTVVGLDVQAMEPLDAAMADLEFEAAAIECDKLIRLWS